MGAGFLAYAASVGLDVERRASQVPVEPPRRSQREPLRQRRPQATPEIAEQSVSMFVVSPGGQGLAWSAPSYEGCGPARPAGHLYSTYRFYTELLTGLVAVARVGENSKGGERGWETRQGGGLSSWRGGRRSS